MKEIQLTLSRKVGMRDINTALSAPISRIKMLWEDVGRRGFTLIELLIIVLIIGMLVVIALPQYQKAVLKSRYSAMMPIAKALAEGNEVYYMEHGNYSEDPTVLMVQGKAEYPDGTNILMYDEGGLSYVRTMNANVPSARYLVYQKHSGNFADTTMCEAANDRANALCQAIGGEEIFGGNSSGEDGWTAYLLTGSYGRTDTFAVSEEKNNEEESGNDTPTVSCNGAEKPDDIGPTDTNPATGTATCVNGQWKYQWTGGKVYTMSYQSDTIVCTGSDEYSCAGSIFKGARNVCDATAENGCANSTFSASYSYCMGDAANGCSGSTFGSSARCVGNVSDGCADSIFSGWLSSCRANTAYGCVNSTFSGTQSTCIGDAANGCSGSSFNGEAASCSGNVSNGCAGATFSGKQAFCKGYTSHGCAGAIIQGGAFCSGFSSGGCYGAKYGVDPSDKNKGMGSCWDGGYGCPVGVPLTTPQSWNATSGSYDIIGWKGNCCNPTYMVSGECPADIAVCGS